MTKKELIDNKYPIDKNYREQMNLTLISQLETDMEFYERSHTVTAAILKIHEDDYITQIKQGHISVEQHIHILFIGENSFLLFNDGNHLFDLAHAPSLETCTRKSSGGKYRPDVLEYVIRNVDFSSQFFL